MKPMERRTGEATVAAVKANLRDAERILKRTKSLSRFPCSIESLEIKG